jgi:hypothetical protein
VELEGKVINVEPNGVMDAVQLPLSTASPVAFDVHSLKDLNVFGRIRVGAGRSGYN